MQSIYANWSVQFWVVLDVSLGIMEGSLYIVLIRSTLPTDSKLTDINKPCFWPMQTFCVRYVWRNFVAVRIARRSFDAVWLLACRIRKNCCKYIAAYGRKVVCEVCLVSFCGQKLGTQMTIICLRTTHNKTSKFRKCVAESASFTTVPDVHFLVKETNGSYPFFF